MLCVIAVSREGYENFPDQLNKLTGCEFAFISSPEELTLARLRDLRPRYVFFPHWSHMISAEIFNAFECIIFHMTDVPFGRGGSPLQNLISRGIYETKISALRCVKELDAGPVYLKRPLLLHGNAEEIYQRVAMVVEGMIVEIIEKQPKPLPQQGEPVRFRRRKPEESDISKVESLQKAFDYIRMLDADGYPRAFLETENLRFEFERAVLKDGEIRADVRIVVKNEA